ncbi:hypothetical protein OROGR_022751 [Orobanche gracilis]
MAKYQNKSKSEKYKELNEKYEDRAFDKEIYYNQATEEVKNAVRPIHGKNWIAVDNETDIHILVVAKWEHGFQGNPKN